MRVALHPASFVRGRVPATLERSVQYARRCLDAVLQLGNET